MRIAYDSNIFTMQAYGGVSRYMVRLGEEQMKLGNEVEAFGWLHKNRYLVESELRTRMRYIEEFPPRTRRVAHQVGDWMGGRRMGQWKPDIIHETFCHDRSVGPARTPRVCTIHDLIHVKFPKYRGAMNRIPCYQQKAIDRCDAVICVSESTRRDLLECLKVDPTKIKVIHHGFEHACGTGDLSPEEHGILAGFTDRPYLLYVGARAGYKNFQGFLEALRASNQGRDLGVVAFGGGGFTEGERIMIQELGFTEGAVLQAGGSDDLLRALYGSAEAFVYPSIYEGFGFPPLEAMAEGCPVISSDTSSMPEVIGDAAEYFDPLSRESMAAAIDDVLANAHTRKELIAKGRQRIKCFPWAGCAKSTEDLYHAIM